MFLSKLLKIALLSLLMMPALMQASKKSGAAKKDPKKSSWLSSAATWYNRNKFLLGAASGVVFGAGLAYAGAKIVGRPTNVYVVMNASVKNDNPCNTTSRKILPTALMSVFGGFLGYNASSYSSDGRIFFDGKNSYKPAHFLPVGLASLAGSALLYSNAISNRTALTLYSGFGAGLAADYFNIAQSLKDRAAAGVTAVQGFAQQVTAWLKPKKDNGGSSSCKVGSSSLSSSSSHYGPATDVALSS